VSDWWEKKEEQLFCVRAFVCVWCTRMYATPAVDGQRSNRFGSFISFVRCDEREGERERVYVFMVLFTGEGKGAFAGAAMALLFCHFVCFGPKTPMNKPYISSYATCCQSSLSLFPSFGSPLAGGFGEWD